LPGLMFPVDDARLVRPPNNCVGGLAHDAQACRPTDSRSCWAISADSGSPWTSSMTR